MKVAHYARVSCDKQDKALSVSAQLKALREFATSNRYEVVKEFVDEAKSGKTTDRPAFMEMISMARRSPKPFDLILVWKYSRFARNRYDSMAFKMMLRKKAIKVVSISERFDNSASGELMEGVVEVMDEFYSANLGEDVTRGMRESASRGFYVGAYAPYGYSKAKVNDGGKERTKLKPEPHQAAVIAGIFKEALEGKNLKDIVKRLNREGIAGPRGKGWQKTTVYNILTNEVYTGTLVWGTKSHRELAPIRVENGCLAIIDKGIFERVQAVMKERAPAKIHPRRVNSRYLLSGIARCGHCGNALVGQDAKSGQFSYYVCGTLLKKGAGSCKAGYLRSQQFEGIVIEQVKQHILTKENLAELVKLVNEEMEGSTEGDRLHHKGILDEIADTDCRLERLYDSLETGKLRLEDLAPRIQQLRCRQEQLRATKLELEQHLSDKRVDLADLETVTYYVEDLRNLLSESTPIDRKAFIRSFVKEVKVTGNEVSLTYTLPLPPAGTIEEQIAVPPIVQYGGRRRIRTFDPYFIRVVL